MKEGGRKEKGRGGMGKGSGRGEKQGREGEWWRTEKTSPPCGSVCPGQKDGHSLISIRLSF